jgi:hypothetical protein
MYGVGVILGMGMALGGCGTWCGGGYGCGVTLCYVYSITVGTVVRVCVPRAPPRE